MTTENKVIFEQLKEYSNHLEKYGANRLHDILAILSAAQRDDIKESKRGNVVETGAMQQTEEAVQEIKRTQEKVSRIIVKSKSFFAC